MPLIFGNSCFYAGFSGRKTDIKKWIEIGYRKLKKKAKIKEREKNEERITKMVRKRN